MTLTLQRNPSSVNLKLMFTRLHLYWSNTCGNFHRLWYLSYSMKLCASWWHVTFRKIRKMPLIASPNFYAKNSRRTTTTCSSTCVGSCTRLGNIQTRTKCHTWTWLRSSLRVLYVQRMKIQHCSWELRQTAHRSRLFSSVSVPTSFRWNTLKPARRLSLATCWT